MCVRRMQTLQQHVATGCMYTCMPVKVSCVIYASLSLMRKVHVSLSVTVAENREAEDDIL